MKTNFTIQVTNELDAEYAQRFLYRHGIKWFFNVPGLHDETANMGFIYVRGGKIDGWDRKGNISWSDPTYKFPSQYEEIVKLLEKEKELELSVDQWVINTIRKGKEYAYKLDADLIREYKNQARCYSSFREWFDSCLRIATPSEIEESLIKEAEKKGFVVGAKVKLDGLNYTIGFLKLITGENCKMSGMCEVYFKNNGLFLAALDGACLFPIDKCELIHSHPQIKINGYTAKFKDWGLDFNGGCAKIDK